MMERILESRDLLEPQDSMTPDPTPEFGGQAPHRQLRFPWRSPLGDGRALPWVSVAPHAPYFVTDDGAPWHPIGQNDSISWVELGPLYRRRNHAAVDAHLGWLARQGVTCLRLMMEYAQVRHRYIEKPAGTFAPDMVRMWDDLFALCARHGLRILLTPFDTFWMWLHFRHHPYSRDNGGMLRSMSEILICPETRVAIKARLSFAVERWGGSGALFAWDLWNEIHPAQARDSAEPFADFIADLSRHVREREQALYGRTHPQTVSVFGPELKWRAHMTMEGPIFRHPDLDFATIHIYEKGTIDNPADTVAAAVGMGRVVRDCLAEIRDGRPFLDSEHGPIHRFKDIKKNLPEPFDDEYFTHMQWAHLASGGAGGGMRWPNRKPHVLTRGMRAAQRALANFMPHIDWLSFDRRNISAELEVRDADGRALTQRSVARFGCASADQAVLYLLRRDTLGPDGRLDPAAPPRTLRVAGPGLPSGPYRGTLFDPVGGEVLAADVQALDGHGVIVVRGLVTGLAVAIRSAA